MEELNWFNFLLFFAIICCLFKFLLIKRAKYNLLPPGPRTLPLIGHLHLLKQPIHRSLHDLSQRYGPVMFLQFGTRNVLVVSSPKAVEECFTKNDITFANRPQLLSGEIINYRDFCALGLSNYGDHWRNLRRFITLELLSSTRLSMLKNIRQHEVHLLLKQLYQSSEMKPAKVDLRLAITGLNFNIMMRMLTGKRYYGKDAVDEEAIEFQHIMSEIVEVFGVSNLGDFLPIFKWIDIQGMKRKMSKLMKKIDKFSQNLVDECRRLRNERIQKTNLSNGSSKESQSTLIDAMLSLQETDLEFRSDESIKSILLSLIVAGTETTTTAIEWVMAFLLNHPHARSKVLAEIESTGGQGRLLDENDLPKLNYLQNVIDETLRLCPPVPLNVPHESSEDCIVCGFKVPKGTMLLVNLWTLQRDPKLWEEPTKFRPERFDGGEGGEGYNLIPFGAGRRTCPGANLARKVVALATGSLVQCFDWEREGQGEIDMTEGTGLTMPKKEPLRALCKPRQAMVHSLSQL